MKLREMLPELGQRTHIMGILNVTPDSFSDGGRLLTAAAAIEAARSLRAEGADIIDVGGESTRPGARPVHEDEEMARVLPVLEGLWADREDGMLLSVDTTKASVAEAAVAAGAHIVNDISAMTFDPQMAPTVARLGVPVVLSHTRARPHVMQKGDLAYDEGVVEAVRTALNDAIEGAIDAGIARDDIVVDPGIGFGKTLEDNLRLLRRLDALAGFGHPVLVGTSRKTFLGTLTGQPVEERMAATIASVVYAIGRGADIVRVHDVTETRDAVRVADALVRSPTT